ncbi:MAG: ribulose-phosphate 3-epimerase [bacterium]
MKKIDIFPSILNADWTNMDRELSDLKKAGADGIHLDIMDGKFVPEKTFDLDSIERFVSYSDLPFDAHLMIEEPEKHVDDYMERCVTSITFHLEVCNGEYAVKLAKYIKSKGLKAGVAVNPDHPVEPVIDLIAYFDWVLFMSVFPGYGGQKFIPQVLEKVMILKEYCTEKNLNRVIQIDGGINDKTAALAVKAGINNLVAGTYILKSENYKERIDKLKQI